VILHKPEERSVIATAEREDVAWFVFNKSQKFKDCLSIGLDPRPSSAIDNRIQLLLLLKEKFGIVILKITKLSCHHLGHEGVIRCLHHPLLMA
jgi:hypothetical protein